MKLKRLTRSTPVRILEVAIVYVMISTAGFVPIRVMRGISIALGDALFFVSSRRRNIALDNLTKAFISEKNEKEIRRIARESCRQFIFTFLEVMKFRHHFNDPDRRNSFRQKTKNISDLFKNLREIHDSSGGCIIVTPHIGNWEMLPHIASNAGIPVAVVARPLDNKYLERLIYADRTSSGQGLIHKNNALSALRKTLRSGISVGMLPDQSTAKGLEIDFFGRPATTTPVPALLSINCKKPIVVVACCRKNILEQYDGFVSAPIWPGNKNKKEEIFRITTEMNRQMEKIIRKYPEQYLWMHNRWKTYKGQKAIFSERK
ncbi:MAG: lysophospholipid acyltransferase family protein [Nitrospiraceae bacterium]|nr:MAG: lysophospholipid acyltransferase family protein [Nitrospiraceae bacterium]